MEAQDRQEQLRRNSIIVSAIVMLKRVKNVAQLSPFIYTLAYIAILLLYNVASEIVLDVLDDLFYVSPIVIAVNLIYSGILKLCPWHKAACLLPLIPEAANIIDSEKYIFYVDQSVLLNYSTAITAVLFIIAAYKVFFYDRRKETAI